MTAQYLTGPGCPTVTALLACVYCQWSAVMTGDTADEVARFLRHVGRDHLETLHPDRRCYGVLVEETPS